MKKIIYLLCVLVFVFASCTFDQAGHPLKVAIERPLSTLNYQKSASTADMEQMSQIMEGLLVFDGQGEVAAAGAKSWKISDDGFVYQFALREDAKWQDGSTVLAQDYYFAWLEIVANKTSPFAYTLFPIKNAEKIYQAELPVEAFGVKVLGDFALEITLEKPYLSFIYSLATPTMYPLKQSFYESVGQDAFGTSKEQILTNGAYNIREYEATSKLFLTKSVTYWNMSQVEVLEVEVYVVPEEAARRALFDEGNLDIMSIGADSREHYQERDVQIVSEKTAKINYLYLSGQTLQDNQLLKNENLRKSIAYAIDRNTVTENILKDGSVPLTRLVPCDFAFIAGVDYCELKRQDMKYTFDVEQARFYFALATEELTGEGVALNLNIVYQEAENNVNVLENLKFQLEKVLPGLNVTLTGFPIAGYSSMLRKDGIASAVQTWSGSFPNPEVYLQILEENSSFNFPKYHDAGFEARYWAAMNSIDKQEQFRLYAEAEDIALQSYMVLPLYQKGMTYVLSKRVVQFNYKMTLPNVYYKNLKLS